MARGGADVRVDRVAGLADVTRGLHGMMAGGWLEEAGSGHVEDGVAEATGVLMPTRGSERKRSCWAFWASFVGLGFWACCSSFCRNAILFLLSSSTSTFFSSFFLFNLFTQKYTINP